MSGNSPSEALLDIVHLEVVFKPVVKHSRPTTVDLKRLRGFLRRFAVNPRTCKKPITVEVHRASLSFFPHLTPSVFQIQRQCYSRDTSQIGLQSIPSRIPGAIVSPKAVLEIFRSASNFDQLVTNCRAGIRALAFESVNRIWTLEMVSWHARNQCTFGTYCDSTANVRA